MKPIAALCSLKIYHNVGDPNKDLPKIYHDQTKNEISVKSVNYNINLPMVIFTSTNNISPNSSESFYIDSPSPPLISMATSLRFA